MKRFGGFHLRRLCPPFSKLKIAQYVQTLGEDSLD